MRRTILLLPLLAMSATGATLEYRAYPSSQDPSLKLYANFIKPDQPRPILLFMAVMTTIGVFNMFAQPWLLTHGGPGYSSNTLIIFLYRTAFEIMQFGYAAAIGVTIFILTAFFSFLQITFNRGFSSD